MWRIYPFLASAIVLILSQVFLWPCQPESGYTCTGTLAGSVGTPLLLGGLALLVVSTFLLFTNENILKVWAMVSTIYAALASILVAVTPEECNAPLAMCFDKELASWWLSGLFVVISIGIIIYKRFREATQSSGK